MAKIEKCPECGAIIEDENATFCKKCQTSLKGRKTRWLVPK